MNFVPAEEKEIYDNGLKGKQTKIQFSKGQATRATKVLEIIRSNVCGTMRAKSLSGNSYFVTFIDNKSRYTAIYFMERKDQVFDIYLEYEAMVENLTSEKIECLRTDNGGEYLSIAFNEHLKRKGIKRQLTVPGTPQQNGVAERANRTLQEIARSILCTANLPDIFWAAEAVLTAVILKNRSPTVAVKDGIDYEKTFSPVAWYTTIRSIIAVANQLDLELHQMDAANAFLNGNLQEELFMKQPQGYEEKNEEISFANYKRASTV